MLCLIFDQASCVIIDDSLNLSLAKVSPVAYFYKKEIIYCVPTVKAGMYLLEWAGGFRKL